MNLYLPSVGLGRGRVWRSHGWAGGQPSKPWLGTLNSGLLASGGSGGTMIGGGAACSWAQGNDLPYIQQTFMTNSAESLSDFSLPSSPTSDDHPHPLYHLHHHHQQQQLSPVMRSPVAADETTLDVKQHSESFDVTCSLYVLAIYLISIGWILLLLLLPCY